MFLFPVTDSCPLHCEGTDCVVMFFNPQLKVLNTYCAFVCVCVCVCVCMCVRERGGGGGGGIYFFLQHVNVTVNFVSCL